MPYKDYEKTKENARLNYYKNKEKKLEQVKAYYLANWEKRQKQRNKWMKNHAEKVKEYKKKYNYRKYPQDKKSGKVLARWKVSSAIKAGKLKRGKCTVCSSSKWIHAHHEDYSKPLEVVWLCPLHHSDVHKKIVIK